MKTRRRQWDECARSGAQTGRHTPVCKRTGCAGCYHPCDYTGRHRDGCADEACPGCSPRRAERGRLCNRCFDALSIAVASLRVEWGQLADRLAPRANPALVRVSGSKPRQLPIDPKIADLRGEIASLLASWVGMVKDEREMIGPAGDNPQVTSPWLGAQLEWAAEQEWISDMADELIGVQRRANAALFPDDRKRVEIGRCLHVGEDDVQCPGVVRTYVARFEGDTPPPLVCSVDESHRWARFEFQRLITKGMLAA